MHGKILSLLNNTEDISEEELDKVVTNLLDGISSILPKIVGENLDIKITDKDKKATKEIIQYFMGISKEKTHLDSLTLPKDDKLKQQFQFAEKMFSDILGVENPFSKMISSYGLKEVYLKYNSDKKYAEQSHETIQKIMNIIIQHGLSEKFTTFLQTMGETSAFASFQYVSRISKIEKYLIKNRKYFSQRIVEKYIQYYKELIAYVDMLIPLWYGTYLLRNNKYKSIPDIRKTPNGIILKEFKKDSLFTDLLTPYDHHIRNAFAHGIYFIDPVGRTITLKDNKVEIKKTFREFVIHVQEIIGLLSILSRIEHEMSLARFKIFESEKKKLYDKFSSNISK